MRWTTRDLAIVVIMAALACTVYQIHWGHPFHNASLIFSLNLGLLTTSMLAAWYTTSRRRGFFLGYACFGSLYLVFVLRGGFGHPNRDYVEIMTGLSVMGMLLGLICALAAYLLAPAATEHATDQDGERKKD